MSDVRVRILELEPNTKAEWHYHTEVSENCFCLEGKLTVELTNSGTKVILNSGERCTVEIGRIHRVANETNRICKYLLVQDIGYYDMLRMMKNFFKIHEFRGIRPGRERDSWCV